MEEKYSVCNDMERNDTLHSKSELKTEGEQNHCLPVRSD